MRLAVPYIQNELHNYNDHAHTAHRNADIGLFQRRRVWISERASRVLYKQETRALASESQSFGHNLCPQGSLT